MIEGETMINENKKIARLIKQIQHGNQSAFEEFYKLTSPKAYFIALKITQNEHDAEDILQESYIKALEKINEIDTSQNISSWFLKIVSNKSKDLLKRRNRLVFDSEEEGFFDEIPEEKAEFCPEENLNQEELRHEVMAAIDELTAEKRACIMMMYFGYMSIREIAESIEVPESTVKNRLYTARKDLKTKFEKNGNVLYGAALGSIIIWALQKTSVTASAAFAASEASAEILAGIGTSATASASAAAAGTGITAKLAALSAAQKVVAGIAATAVIGGSTAGIATVAKKIVSSNETTAYTEEVTTTPLQTEEYAFAVSPSDGSTTEPLTATEMTGPTATVHDESTAKLPSATSTTISAQTTASTTRPAATTKPHTTQKETSTQRETTTKVTTTRTLTTTVPTTQPTTQPTTVPATVPTTQAPARLVIEVVDMDENVVATLDLTVNAGTEMTWEYLVSLIKQNGYEPKAGVYGDGVGAVAESGTTYTFTAEL